MYFTLKWFNRAALSIMCLKQIAYANKPYRLFKVNSCTEAEEQEILLFHRNIKVKVNLRF